ncbi:hypothetical protein COCOBI_09-5660 [Coccomyxa sp. Obi]|nr:hypothetical protein COCOBI_09-5660 [Coccomyxa sp. Obi]
MTRRRFSTEERWADITEEDNEDLEQWLTDRGFGLDRLADAKPAESTGNKANFEKHATSMENGGQSPRSVFSQPPSTDSSPPSSSPSSPRCSPTAAQATAEDWPQSSQKSGLLRHAPLDMRGASARGRPAFSCNVSAWAVSPSVDQWPVDITPEGCWDEPWSPPPAQAEADAFFGAASSSRPHRAESTGAQRLITAAVRAATLPAKAKPSRQAHGRSVNGATSGSGPGVAASQHAALLQRIHESCGEIFAPQPAVVESKQSKHVPLLQRIHASCNEIFTPQPAMGTLDGSPSVQEVAGKQQGNSATGESSHSCREPPTMGQPSGSCAPTCSGHLPAAPAVRPTNAGSASQPRQQPPTMMANEDDAAPQPQPALGVHTADADTDSGPLTAASQPENQGRTADNAGERLLLGCIPTRVQSWIGSAVTAGYCAAGVVAAMVECGSRLFRWR